MGDLRELSVGAAEERPIPLSPTSSNPSPSSIGAERWGRAEEAIKKIICRVQPTDVSEKRRREVIDYIQRLIRGYLVCEVFPFGSVPLKTYLPDGDIDLTAFGGASVEDALVNDVVAVLEAEDKNKAAEFIVKDVQLIRAEVKLVKCIVQNIVVDISFNQLGGLCTLCFLGQVDRLIGKDHLFKRSIILIKAWCYYESRILGAHHGLISTYALETLVLYIFHLFHSTLNGPLAVLYRFLDYFSKFDWDNYCISLTGPVRISSLPEIVAEKPENGGSDLLLSSDFLRQCTDMFSVPSRGVDSSRTFPPKHLNIIDPLKENNNLGRSVSKGNFYRIRSAFSYGARKLGGILSQPQDNLVGELRNFFSNTLDRHGSRQRPDVQDPVPMSDCRGPAFSSSETVSGPEVNAKSDLKSANLVGDNGIIKLIANGSSNSGGNNVDISGTEKEVGRTINGQREGPMELINSLTGTDCSVSGLAVVGHRISGDAEDLATFRVKGLKISNDSPKGFYSSPEVSASQQGIAHHAPHLYFSGSVSGDGKLGHGSSDMIEPDTSSSLAGKVSSGLLLMLDEGTFQSQDVASVSNPVASISNPASSSSVDDAVDLEYLKSLSDLGGDYDGHVNSLQYARWCFEHSLTMPGLPMPPPLPSQFQSKSSWDMIRHSNQFKRNGYSYVSPNGVIPRPGFYRMNTLVIPGATFSVEEMPKPRGTGTYFPNTNRPPYLKPLNGRGRNQGPVRSPRSNGRGMTPTEANFQDRASREPSQAQFFERGNAKPGSSDLYESSLTNGKVQPHVNGLLLQSEGGVEFGSVGHVPSGVPVPESGRQLNPNHASSLPHASQSCPTPGTQKSEPVMVMNKDRIMVKSSYRLKDEDDFPPLSV